MALARLLLRVCHPARPARRRGAGDRVRAPCRQALVRDRVRRRRGGAARAPARSQRGHQAVVRRRERLSRAAVRPRRLVRAGRHPPLQPDHLDHLRDGAPADQRRREGGGDRSPQPPQPRQRHCVRRRRHGGEGGHRERPADDQHHRRRALDEAQGADGGQLARSGPDHVREPLHHAESEADRPPDRHRGGADQDVHGGRASPPSTTRRPLRSTRWPPSRPS
jgi:hypothetical protein